MILDRFDLQELCQHTNRLTTSKCARAYAPLPSPTFAVVVARLRTIGLFVEKRMQCRDAKKDSLDRLLRLKGSPSASWSSNDDTARPRSGPGRVGQGGQRFLRI